MFDKQPWYIVAVVALVIGLILGRNTAEEGDEMAALDARLAAVEMANAEKIDGLADVLAALTDEMTAQNGVLGEGQAALDTKVAAIESAVAAMEPMGADDITAAMNAAFEAHAKAKGHHGKKDGKHGDAHHGDQAAEASSESDETTPSDTAAATEESHTVSAGQTIKAGDGHLFISQITEDAVIGVTSAGDKVELGGFGPSLSIGGCEMALDGIADGAATIRAICG